MQQNFNSFLRTSTILTCAIFYSHIIVLKYACNWNTHITICEIDRQSRFNTSDRVLRAGALGWPWGMGRGGLVCCNSWGRKESDMTEWLNWTELSGFLPYIDMNQPWVYMCSSSWTPLPPPSPSYPSGSSQCTSPEDLVSCIEPGLVICFTFF